jgi:glycosyltransferase involved in cell wall biosynthesis
MPNYEGYWCFREAKHLRLPILLELHGDWETAVLEQETGNAVRGAMKPYLARLAKSAVFEVAGAASGIISIGPKLAEKYTPAGTPFLVSTNHLLDECDYRQRRDFSLHDPPRILFVGALQRRKGLHFLFSALDELHRQGIPFDMVLAGTGPQEAPLRRFAAEKGFSDNVTFAGWVPHGPDLLEIYRNADIFVLPSIAAEGVPRVTHEAMASGCPVIAADVGSIAWQLREGAGLLVPPRDAPALAKAVTALLTDEPLRARLSRTGYTRSMEHTFGRQRETLRQFMKSWRVPPGF